MRIKLDIAVIVPTIPLMSNLGRPKTWAKTVVLPISAVSLETVERVQKSLSERTGVEITRAQVLRMALERGLKLLT